MSGTYSFSSLLINFYFKRKERKTLLVLYKRFSCFPYSSINYLLIPLD
ncbi:hypothetical protein DB41_IB00420 [Neochlamydia sp. TUME1]|nr:hypothetical protein DB41_IB00420 [Neochlamydia sp. TUME1]